MKKISQYMVLVIMSMLVVFSGCKDDSYELGSLVTPTNLKVTYEIVGVDDENPYGDGSGMVNFTATADNAITFTFDFGDGSSVEVAADGSISHPFSKNGIVTYDVTISAVGTGGIITNTIEQVEVFSNFQDEDALEWLTGGDSKTWYWASNLPAHAGLGPDDEDYGNLDFTWPNWWQISPWDPDKECMYAAEFVFTKTANGLTFEQTTGPAFIPGAYASVIGVDGDVCHGEDVVPSLYGVKNVVFSPSSSRAALEGGYRGTTFKISDDGFMCWYVGASEYDIIEISETLLRVRIKQDDTYAWYHIFTSEKPVP